MADKKYVEFDFELAIERSGGGLERFKEMADFFPRYSKDLWAPIEKAQKEGDLELLKASVHKIKGSLGMVGALKAYDVAVDLEKNVTVLSRSEIDAQVGLLKDQLNALLVELDRFAM